MAVLWSAVFIVVSVLQRPVEQLLSRTISENLAHDAPIGRTVRVAATIQLGVAVALRRRRAGAPRRRSRTTCLHGNSTLYWIGVAAVTAYGASYFARGFLAGSHRLTIYALLIISESVARTAFPSRGRARDRLGPDRGRARHRRGPHPLADRGARSRSSAASGAPAPGRRSPPSTSPVPAPDSPEFTLARGGRFAAAVFLIMLSEQTFLNAGALLVNATAGRGRGRLHLQRADDRPGAAAALPGGSDQPPPPPHPPRLRRETRRTSAPRSG